MSKKIILGDEYDDELRGGLMNLLKRWGGKLINCDWSVAGSQELDSATVNLDGKDIHIESETYVGLSISGDEAQVSRIAKKLGK
ncbi:hypothetical protein ACFQ1E_20785 [Sphingomonas canadensis]|uniref:Polyhydroxyalkanoic acid system protein n=1 Tax=Sphingomonas canadensis TaxID=1219257 RepID=A0ABW3HD63_9SPHN|nr:hypothetical protein [Sphingomonas canadensis]MCW3838480.1 hypothetical protein [Sphingomonas canadensis]